MTDPLIVETIRHLEVGNIEAADGSFTDYYKKYIRSNTKNAVRSTDEIKSDLDLLVPYVSAFPSRKNSFGAAHSNLFKRQQASGDWNKYVLRTMISHAYSDIGVKKNLLASAPKGIAGTKRKLNNRNAPVMPVAANRNNNTGPSGLKLRVKAPFGTLKQNRAAAAEKSAPKKPRWIGYAELPNSPVAAVAPLKPKNRYGRNVSASNNSNVMREFAAARGEIPTTASPAAALLPGLNNNSNNDPFASAYAPSPFPNVGPMKPALNVGPGPLSLVLPYGRNAPQSPGFRPRAGNTPKSINNLRAMGFRGGKRSTRRKLRSRSTRRRKL
jgi:hypothetical protein